jgi:hypothetical protein
MISPVCLLVYSNGKHGFFWTEPGTLSPIIIFAVLSSKDERMGHCFTVMGAYGKIGGSAQGMGESAV